MRRALWMLCQLYSAITAMKTRLTYLLCTGLISLLTATLSLATHVKTNPERKPNTGWITSTDVVFKIRATQTQDNQLTLHVQNPGFERLWLNLRTLDGEDVFHLPLSESQAMHVVNLDIRHLVAGPYRVEVFSGINKVATIIPLALTDLNAPETSPALPDGE